MDFFVTPKDLSDFLCDYLGHIAKRSLSDGAWSQDIGKNLADGKGFLVIGSLGEAQIKLPATLRSPVLD